MASTAAEWVAKALKEAGGSTENPIFSVAFVYGTSGGSSVWGFNGFETMPLVFPHSAADLKLALLTLPTIDACSVLGPMGGPFTIELKGGNAGQEVPPISVDGANLIPTQEVEVEVLQQGESSDLFDDATQSWTDHADDARSDYHRYLLVKLDLYDIRLNKIAETAVDNRTGQINIVETKGSQRYSNLEKLRNRVQGAITAHLVALSNASSRSHGGVMKRMTPNGKAYGEL